MNAEPARGARYAAASVPAAFLAANLLSYALLLIAAHAMSSSRYGVLSSLLSLLLIATIPMLAIQTVAARRAANGAAASRAVRGCAQLAILTTLVVVVLSPAASRFLHIDGIIGVLLVALTVPATTFLGAATGIAQGRRQFRRLAMLVLAATGARSLGGIVGLLLGDSPEATLLGVVVGLYSACAVVVCSDRVGPTLLPALRFRDDTGLLGETLHAGHAHGVFLLLTSLDVLLARHVLTPHDAGVYAVGSVVTRASLWLPQSVVLLLFASLAESRHHRAAARRAAAVVVGLGLAVVAGCVVLGGLVVDVVGGARYEELDDSIWLFAAIGALLAVVQLAVLAGLAQRSRRRTLLLWATVTADVAVVLSLGSRLSTTTLAITLLCVAGFAAAVAAIVTVRQEPASAGHGPGANAVLRPEPNDDTRPVADG